MRPIQGKMNEDEFLDTLTAVEVEYAKAANELDYFVQHSRDDLFHRFAGVAAPGNASTEEAINLANLYCCKNRDPRQVPAEHPAQRAMDVTQVQRLQPEISTVNGMNQVQRGMSLQIVREPCQQAPQKTFETTGGMRGARFPTSPGAWAGKEYAAVNPGTRSQKGHPTMRPGQHDEKGSRQDLEFDAFGRNAIQDKYSMPSAMRDTRSHTSPGTWGRTEYAAVNPGARSAKWHPTMQPGQRDEKGSRQNFEFDGDKSPVTLDEMNPCSSDGAGTESGAQRAEHEHEHCGRNDTDNVDSPTGASSGRGQSKVGVFDANITEAAKTLFDFICNSPASAKERHFSARRLILTEEPEDRAKPANGPSEWRLQGAGIGDGSRTDDRSFSPEKNVDMDWGPAQVRASRLFELAVKHENAKVLQLAFQLAFANDMCPLILKQVGDESQDSLVSLCEAIVLTSSALSSPKMADQVASANSASSALSSPKMADQVASANSAMPRDKGQFSGGHCVRRLPQDEPVLEQQNFGLVPEENLDHEVPTRDVAPNWTLLRKLVDSEHALWARIGAQVTEGKPSNLVDLKTMITEVRAGIFSKYA